VLAKISIFLLYVSCSFAQQPLFERYTVENGLSQNLILSMAEDKHGFLWFGTKDGLNRFDGHSFRSYRSNLNDSLSLSSNYISALIVDGAGILWIGTAGGGLNRFNEDAGTFSSWRNKENDSTSIPSNFVVDISAVSNGDLLVATQGGGVSRFDIREKIFTPLFSRLPVQTKSILGTVQTMYLENDALLWIGTRDDGLWRYEMSSGNIKQYSNKNGVRGLSNVRVKNIYKNNRGVLWVCTENGIEEFDSRTETFTLHRFPDSAGVLQPGVSIRQISDETYFVNVWTDQGIYNPRTRVFHSAKFGVINRIFTDRSGMMWLSASGYGVIKYNPILERFHKKSGSFFYELFINDFTRVERKLQFPLSLTGIDLQTVAKGRNGALWFFKKGRGYYRFDSRTDALKLFPAGDSIKGIRFQFLPRTFIDKDNTVWISESTILARYNPRSETFTYFSLPSYTKNSELMRNFTDYPPITALLNNNGGNLWLGTTGMGLLRFNPAAGELKIFRRDEQAAITLTNNFILTIHTDPADSTILWLGTDGGGINRFDTKTGRVTNYFTTAEGLPNNVIYGILSDSQGKFWMSSNNGLFVFDPATMKVLNRYDVNDGLQSNEFNRYQYLKDENGKLCFGGINGWNSFYPEEIQPRAYIPPVVLTDLRIFNASVVYPRIALPLQTSLANTTQIVLQPDQNMITIEFASLDYAAPRKNRYKYFLDGLDEHWIDASVSAEGIAQTGIRQGTERTATYTNLDPGEYIFHVKGTNSDGVWNDTERTLTIIVTPPFWKTAWFRILSAVIVLVIVGGSIRAIELRKIRERTRALEQETAIERERLRISKDMHDDLGSRLTQIELLSNLTKRNTKDEKSVEKNLEEISTAADEIVTAFDEIVWAVNPRYDTVEDLMDYLAQFVSSYLGRARIESHVDLSPVQSGIHVSAEIRHNIFMVLKESLNNIAKYARAKDVWVEFNCSNYVLTMMVKDNGVGFDVEEVKKFSEGLNNMKKRMEDVGGICEVASAPGTGTTVRLTVQLMVTRSNANIKTIL